MNQITRGHSFRFLSAAACSAALLLFASALLLAVPPEPNATSSATKTTAADETVAAAPSAQFASAQFTTVQAAVDAAPADRHALFTIHIAPGTYKERITVPANKPFLRFLGDAADTTILTFDNFAQMLSPEGKPIGTRNTASVYLNADDFSAENITFENTHGIGSQALAASVTGDRSVFRRCRFLGWQDTLLIDKGRLFFDDCYIAGHVDFIFGASAAYFRNCHIHCVGKGYITAASTPEHQPYGYVFDHCQITGAGPNLTYLGRPWRPFASAIFLNCEMSDVVRPEGWNNWRNPENEKTARYAEYNSTGPGANASSRATWSRQLSADEAAAIIPAAVLAGSDGWNPVP